MFEDGYWTTISFLLASRHNAGGLGDRSGEGWGTGGRRGKNGRRDLKGEAAELEEDSTTMLKYLAIETELRELKGGWRARAGNARYRRWEVWRFGGLDPPLPIPPACSTEGKMTAWKKWQSTLDMLCWVWQLLSVKVWWKGDLPISVNILVYRPK